MDQAYLSLNRSLIPFVDDLGATRTLIEVAPFMVTTSPSKLLRGYGPIAIIVPLPYNNTATPSKTSPLDILLVLGIAKYSSSFVAVLNGVEYN